MARDKLSFPLTRCTPGTPLLAPRVSFTYPPASTIRLYSFSSPGLWSEDSGTTAPARCKIARESPALAHVISSADIKIHRAVHPAEAADASSARSSDAADF